MNDLGSPPRSRIVRMLLGAIVGNLVITALYLGLYVLGNKYTFDHGAWIVVPSLFLVPIAGGLAAAWVWRPLDLRLGACALHSLWMTLLGIAGAAIFFREGVVCLIIVFPLLYATIFTGAALGRIWFKLDRSRIRLTIFPLLALLAASESYTRVDERAIVVDEVLIHASPERVWPYVLAFPEIAELPRYWIFRLGLPYPMKTTNSGDFVGADRQCIFSDGIVIKEKVAEFIPRERLTFDIVEQPTHPEAYGHITLHRGCFDLRGNGDGTTTLIGTSWYTLHVRPLWYFDWWTRDMTRHVHLRVMEHIKELAESGA